MSSKFTGYEFWNNILKTPQYVVAPMVDMSELSFRMLCRHYNAQLCFSPMLHSQQYLQDSLYRLDTFSTCPEDKPLIVQFCSNDPDDFVNAGMMVSSQCEAIDLNLGCPQAIARKGQYGAFLQDDWDRIHSIVRKGSTDLPVPVTCKMRILPDFKKSIQYAKMLENAGCSVITVHGRSRDQKGHATGLASWEVIKLIKENVKIPVIANGNILSFADVKECLSYTGADAVMSAEAILHNPALFSGKNPPVWDIVEEYLQYAEKYKTPLRCVRCHLFRILYLCIHQDSKVQEILADGKSYADFYAVCDLLKAFPEKYISTVKRRDDVNINSSSVCDNFPLHSWFWLCADDIISMTGRYTAINGTNNEVNYSNPFFCGKTIKSYGISELFTGSNNNVLNDKEYGVTSNITDEVFEDNNSKSKYLPTWICHSRPRVTENDDRTRGCYSKYFQQLSDESQLIQDKHNEEQSLSKKKLRKVKHHERVLTAVKEKRKIKKLRRKQKLMEQRQLQNHEKRESEVGEKITKKEKKMLIKERLLKARGCAPKICINLGFASLMDNKELTRLSSQLRRLYGSNRKSTSPFHLYFCNLSESDNLYRICIEKNDGFSSYVVEMTEESPEDLFEVEHLVYLSPDSENVLTTLDHKKIYVIGGIVDDTVRKGLSLNHAKEYSIQTARLPIAEHLVKCSQNPGTTVLTVNQVFDILLKYYETKDWVLALATNVPPRKGYCAPSSIESTPATATSSKS